MPLTAIVRKRPAYVISLVDSDGEVLAEVETDSPGEVGDVHTSMFLAETYRRMIERQDAAVVCNFDLRLSPQRNTYIRDGLINVQDAVKRALQEMP